MLNDHRAVSRRRLWNGHKTPFFFLFPTEHKAHLASTLVLHAKENTVGSEIIARPFLDKLSDRSINVYEKDQN